MRMSKTSTDIAVVVLFAAASMLGSGCASRSAVDPVTAGAAPTTGEARGLPVGKGLPQWPPQPLAHEEVATVQASRRNASAFDQALTAMRAGRLAEAERLLLEITTDQPELSGPWVNLGQVYVLREQHEEARLAFRQAVAANPRNCVARNQLGVLSRQLGDFAGAEEHYRACLEQVPDFGDAYLNLGILYELYLGRLPEALEAYRRYQILSGDSDRRVAGWVADLERRLGV